VLEGQPIQRRNGCWSSGYVEEIAGVFKIRIVTELVKREEG
jgi:hypothetical protein